MKAIIPAAGLGTRFLPATKAQPKEMLPVYDKPTIQYVVEEAVPSGIEDIILVTGDTKDLLKTISTSTTNLNTTFKRQERTVNLGKSEKSLTWQTSAMSDKRNKTVWEQQSSAVKDISETNRSQSF